MSSGPWALLREPLVYFALLGLALFGVDRAFRPDERVIHVGPTIHAEVERTVTQELGRAPNATELAQGLERWKRDEALYREALALGLLHEDAVVRRHLITRMIDIGRERRVLPPASEEQLRSFFEAHKQAYASPPVFDLEQVFIRGTDVDAQARAQAILQQLASGAAPEGLGDPFPRGRRFTSKTAGDVFDLLGEDAAKRVGQAPLGGWWLASNARGFHAVRVNGARGGAPEFDKVRAAVLIAYETDQRERAVAEYASEIEQQYRFVDAP